ncbi:hypothetical protein ACLOAU_09250 [Niabella sp. CJ426]|uniref:hypothetical protein n=1 Tax=Niabella sp. CJ426 TaxID=3393740 RepID=UPI003CFC3AE4
MKKLLFLFLMLPLVGLAQQKYFTYQHNGLYGITDVQGNDVVKAAYSDWERHNSIDSLTILENKKGKTLVFHLYNGSKKEYDEFQPNHVYIQDEYFEFITNNKKEYLQGQKSGLQIPLKEKFYEFKNLGPDYIVAKFQKLPKLIKDASPKPAPKKDKNGLTPPQIVREPKTEFPKRSNYYVFKNNKKMVKVKEINSDEYDFPFSIYNNTAATDYASEQQYQYKEDVKPWDHFYKERFDYIAVKDGNAFNLYDKNWKLITNIKSTGSSYDYDEPIAKALTALSKDKRFVIGTANYAVPPSMGGRAPDFLKVEKQNDLNIVSVYQNKQYFFLFKTPAEVKVSGNDITIKSGADSSGCVISRSAPALHLPAQYLTLYKVDFEK